MSPLDEQLLQRKIKLIEDDFVLLTPTNYYDSFLALAHEHVVDETLAASVAKSTGLRNILAHDYDEIDNGKVYDTIHVALSEVPQYLKAILTYL